MTNFERKEVTAHYSHEIMANMLRRQQDLLLDVVVFIDVSWLKASSPLK